MIHLIADKKFLPSRDANNKQTSSPSLNPFSPSPFHQKFHLTPFFPGWNSIRRHNFRPENLLIPSHVARWNFATKIHLLSPSPRRSTEIREASIVFSTPSLTRGGPLLPLKPRGTGLTADRVGRHHHHPPVSTLASAQPRWHFRATRNRTCETADGIVRVASGRVTDVSSLTAMDRWSLDPRTSSSRFLFDD